MSADKRLASILACLILLGCCASTPPQPPAGGVYAACQEAFGESIGQSPGPA